MKVLEIPRKMTCNYHEEASAMIDTWESFVVSKDDFKHYILDKALSFARSKNVKAWIIDATRSKGVFTKELLSFIENEVHPTFFKNGIKYFISIKPQESAFAELTEKSYTNSLSNSGLRLITCSTIDEAIEWIKNNK